jgi:hypothetical protein
MEAYEACLIGRIFDLMERTREGAFDPVGDNALRRGFNQLEMIDAADFLSEGTPFFWMNVNRLGRTRQHACSPQLIRDVLMTGFDSYFHLMPDGTCFALPHGEFQRLILPRLGVVIPNVSPVLLWRRCSEALEVELAGNKLTINLAERLPFTISPEAEAHLRERLRSDTVDGMEPSLTRAYRLEVRDKSGHLVERCDHEHFFLG